MRTLPLGERVGTPVGDIPVVATSLSLADRMGFVKMRCGVSRMDYSLSPGLYATGAPSPKSPVFVTSNYKMTFDILRSHLEGIDSWVLVLDTKGINVWCAAGKGSFGTGELVGRIKSVGLSRIVSHRTLILPQLGAPGISAHEVRTKSGFRVKYGPVEARDIQPYIERGMEATEKMRRITFPMGKRAVLVPVELVTAWKYILCAALFFLLLSGFGMGEFHWERIMSVGLPSVLLLASGILAGTFLVPLFLPWIPGRLFSAKGLLAGIFISILYAFLLPSYREVAGSWWGAISWFLIIPSLSSFMAMNFTGATTFTSLSGVRKEIRISLPVQLVVMAGGMILWIMGRFV